MPDAVVVPGRLFGPASPLLMFGGDVAELRGATVHRYSWSAEPPDHRTPEIEGWVRPGAFKGRGVQPDLSYAVYGEIDSTRAMALTYRTEDFPKKAFVGVAFLLFDTNGERLSGRWYGRGRDGQLAGGKTEWRRSS